jgi:hypothetical protein
MQFFKCFPPDYVESGDVVLVSERALLVEFVQFWFLFLG